MGNITDIRKKQREFPSILECAYCGSNAIHAMELEDQRWLQCVGCGEFWLERWYRPEEVDDA